MLTAPLTSAAQDKAQLDITVCEFTLVDEIAHDRTAFTQGLTAYNGRLYESTGLYGQSGIREVDPTNGAVIRQRDLDKSLFGEGATVLNDKLYQITWKSGRGFIYDPDSLKVADEFTIAGEGWGLTDNNQDLILSDGTSNIRFIDPDTFRVTRTISVTNDGAEIIHINELEFINGFIWANIWQTTWIAKISPVTGKIHAWIDLSSIAQQFSDVGVANGIVWMSDSDTMMVTGKNWPAMFSILPNCL